MDNKVQEFLNDNFGEVRCFSDNNSIWFIAKDICDILEIKNTSLAVNGNVSRNEKGVGDKNKGIYNVNTLGGSQDLLCISEQGLYKLIFKSRKPFAEDFQDWICQTVIPAIRKDGAYINGEEQLKEGNLSEEEFILKAMNILNNKVERLRKENTELKTENDSMKPIVTVAEKFLNTNDTYDIGTFAKILDIKNFGRNKMFAWLKENKILMLNNIPYQIFSKYFNIITTEKNGRTFTKTMIKAIGIKYIYNKLYKSGMIVEKPIEQIIKELKQTA